MKMTNEDYQLMRVTINQKYDDLKLASYDNFMAYLAANNDKRIAWDLSRASGLTSFICDNLYKYLNDSHIETALLKIYKEIKNRGVK